MGDTRTLSHCDTRIPYFQTSISLTPCFPEFYPAHQTFIKEPKCFAHEYIHKHTPRDITPSHEMPPPPEIESNWNTGSPCNHPTIITATSLDTLAHLKSPTNSDKGTTDLLSSLLFIRLWFHYPLHCIQNGTCWPCNRKHALCPCYRSPNLH